MANGSLGSATTAIFNIVQALLAVIIFKVGPLGKTLDLPTGNHKNFAPLANLPGLLFVSVFEANNRQAGFIKLAPPRLASFVHDC